jgi:AAA+ ATPase superfamily predicted ATPase
MSFGGYTKYDFGTKLSEVVSPSRPIRSIQYLKGREPQLDTIDRALFAPGRHVFIYGDRGVGKSSLAATAAYQYQSVESEPIFVSGSTDDTFKTVVANIANHALGRSRVEVVKRQSNTGFEWRGLKWGVGVEISTIDIATQIQSVGDAVELLKQVAKQHSEKPVVVLDEFDTIAEQSERNKFAALLKQLGDQSVNLKFIFTGIGRTLEELLGAHQSAYRQLETVELPRLGWEARREIVVRAAEAFGLNVDDNINWRIAAVSDGYPYYVHLIAEKMLWEAFIDERVVDTLGQDHYQLGLRAAIQSISAELKKPYEQAVNFRPQYYENIIWSTADGDDLLRDIKDMHEAHQVIVQKRGGGNELDRAKYNEYLRKLKEKSFGEILEQVKGRKGWYIYKEKMLRGFVRMQAEANGIQLAGEKMAPKQKIHVPGNARTGYYGPSIPRGVRDPKK